ncbi:MAG: glycosyl hydrolase 115 family protein [Bacteroidaceae bacterium]|nr:glycosyl hydrolase 115 family protein [Bacteroidaceae bacterium]
MKKTFLSLMMLIATCSIQAADNFITFSNDNKATTIELSAGGKITFDANDHKGIILAINNLKSDMQKVMGRSEAPVIIGSLDKSKVIADLMKSNKNIAKLLNSELKGKTEKYIITTIDTKEGKSLLIAGSDKRGTIYGVYELSEQLGVSPWYWWADVPVMKHDKVFAKEGVYTDGEPAVKYRGIFLNDEWPAMGNWTTEKFGGFNHKMYEKVFELVLRLRGNYMWPAMWNAAFYADDPENSKTADEMGICMGTSHHEPLARAHQEWTRVRTRGAWNYDTNREELVNFWKEGVERMNGTEDVLTIGMRGNGDEPMGEKADVNLLERIVEHQRKLIAEGTGKPANKTPQMWALYKEVQEYYEKGMRVPDDVILLLCDDNWGNVRILPSLSGKKADNCIAPHKGGYGMYYHVDYVGGPRNYKWINVSQIQRIWEQMLLTYQSGVDKLWILNVGDLKPMEFPIDFWFKMAWNPNQFGNAGNNTELQNYTERFCAQQFGEAQAKEAARILNLQCKYAHRITPELLNKNTYNLQTGEWDKVVADFKALEADALNQYISLPEEYKDAYNELILFPVRALSNIYSLHYAYAKNDYFASKNDVEANEWATKARQYYDRDSVLCYEYNHKIAGGKWNHMMDQLHIGYRSWQEPRFRYFPQTKSVDEAKAVKPSNIFVEKNGVVSIEAPHFTSCTPSANAQWTTIADYGKTDGAVALMPYTASTDGASITYKFQTNKTGDYTIYLYFAPTFPFNGTQQMSLSLDNGTASVFDVNKHKGDQNYEWEASRINIQKVAFHIDSTTDGIHTLTLKPLNPAIVLERLELDFGGRTKTYLGMPESEMK